MKETTVSSYGGKKDLKYKEYKLEKIKDLIKTKYYLNSKVIYLINNINNNNEYKKYFLNVIIKYLMQVIPSTAIFVLENFEPSDGGGDDTPKKYRVHFYDTDGTTQIHSEKVEEGQSVDCYGGNQYYVRGDASRTKVSCPYGPINWETFLVKWSEPIVYYNVHFLDSNGTTELYTQSVEKGKSVACYGGNDYYVRGDSSKRKVSCPYGPVNSETFLVKWVEPTVYYNVDFYENENDTTPIHTEQIDEGQSVNRYQDSDWYLMGDDNKRPVNFPYIINGPTKFVRIKQFTVRWDKQGEIMEAIEHNVNF